MRSNNGEVWQCLLPTTESSALLLTTPSNAAVAKHNQSARKIILVLQGSIVDGDAVCGPRYVQQADAEVPHMPAGALCDLCIGLLMIDGSLKPTRLLPRITG